MRLSRAARTPFWILMFERARTLFKGHPASTTIKPANALRPSNLQDSIQFCLFEICKIRTDWYKNIPAIKISKGAKRSLDMMLAKLEETD